MIHCCITKALIGADAPFELSVDISMQHETLNTIYGKSGSGKTTILRILAGLEKPDKGFIEINGQVWFDSSTGVNLSPQKRKVGLVFQDYALFTTMTVMENLKFAQGKKNEKKINDLLELTGITSLQDRYPTMLSGGQQQRVAFHEQFFVNQIFSCLMNRFQPLTSILATSFRTKSLNITKALA